MIKIGFNRVLHWLMLILLTSLMSGNSMAQSATNIHEDFNSDSTTHQWIALNGACLTASKQTSVPLGTNPGCVGTSYYSGTTMVGGQTGNALPDDPVAATGALRLTNGGNGLFEKGAIISLTPFSSANGVNVTFNTVTWGGNGLAGSGADGMSFFLLDAARYPNLAAQGTNIQLGASGGSLAYVCSGLKNPAAGIGGGYLGVGIDEYGNFINKGDGGSIYDILSPGGSNNTIGIRGAGNITTTAFPVDSTGTIPLAGNPASGDVITPSSICKYGGYTYSTSSKQTVVTTITYNTTNSTIPNPTYNVTDGGTTFTRVNYAFTGQFCSADYSCMVIQTTTTVSPFQQILDYPVLAYKKLNSSNPIYNQENSSTASRQKANTLSYSITMSASGVLSVKYSYNGGFYTSIINNQKVTSITSGNTVINNGPVPANLLYGFSASTGGGTNVHEITCLKIAPNNNSSSSGGTNGPQNNPVLTNTQVYFASYNPNNWSGSLTAKNLSINAAGVVTIGSAYWDASCALTGGTCTTATLSNSAPNPYSGRAIATSFASTVAGKTINVPVPFVFNSLPAAAQSLLNAGDNLGASRLGYIRGDRSNEQTADNLTASFRQRVSVLGDIIDSSPTFSGVPSASYPDIWVDAVATGASKPAIPENRTGAQTYSAYIAQQTNNNQLNVVFVGANDGMLHGFLAGAGTIGDGTKTNQSTYKSTYNTGQEVMAYIPSVALTTLHNTNANGSLDLSNVAYAHNDFVDAQPDAEDLFYNGAWHTWVVGGTGFGGNANGVDSSSNGTAIGDIFAIDITSWNTNTGTSKSAETDTTVANRIIGDWNSNTITCANVTSNCGAYMGAITGQPVIRRLHSGNWAFIFGNGLNSANGTAGIFVAEITGDPTAYASTGTGITFRYYDTGVGAFSYTDPTTQVTTVTKNGISGVHASDLDGDHITDYVYAGDALGNLWRFDLTRTSPGNWGKVVKIFNASSASASGILQPITSAVSVVSHYQQNTNRVMIDFGTGRQFPQSLISASTFAASGQSLYGVWDWNLSDWNKLNSTQYVALTTDPGITASKLTTQVLSSVAITPTAANNQATTGYTITSNPICFPDLSGCSQTSQAPSPGYGWKVTLPNASEQILYSPRVNNGVFFVNTFIPSLSGVTYCNQSHPSGFTLGIDAGTGGSSSIFGKASNGSGLVGIGLNGVGTVSVVTNGAFSSIVTGTSDGQGAAVQIYPPTAGAGTRLSWLEVR